MRLYTKSPNGATENSQACERLEMRARPVREAPLGAIEPFAPLGLGFAQTNLFQAFARLAITDRPVGARNHGLRQFHGSWTHRSVSSV
jgi:hypothetical protein